MTTLHLRKSISRSPLRLALFLTLACIGFGLSPAVQAVSPPPDGGYPNNNTAEGDSALLSLSTGDDNTANGFEALKNNTVGNFNTATGSLTLHDNTTGSNTRSDHRHAKTPPRPQLHTQTHRLLSLKTTQLLRRAGADCVRGFFFIKRIFTLARARSP